VAVQGRVNARDLRLPEPVGAAVADLSFISLRLVLPSLIGLLDRGDAWICVLVKPQFEAGRKEVGKGGVVRDPAIHQRVVAEIIAEIEKLGLPVLGSMESPIEGPAGNREFLVAAARQSIGARPPSL
jgi:23S rRNA (cytidine1920-2'-O)/16S rRNA (cytidine1409-2'-O)-methyltransferase